MGIRVFEKEWKMILNKVFGVVYLGKFTSETLFDWGTQYMNDSINWLIQICTNFLLLLSRHYCTLFIPTPIIIKEILFEDQLKYNSISSGMVWLILKVEFWVIYGHDGLVCVDRVDIGVEIEREWVWVLIKP